MNETTKQAAGHSMNADPRQAPRPPWTEIQRKIGQQLRAMYTDVVNEGVPDRFAELLQRLDEQDEK